MRLLAPVGLPVCISDARPGSKIRYEWVNGKGGDFYLTGEYLELEPFPRIVHVERMHMPDPTPNNCVETRFEPDHGTVNGSELCAPGNDELACVGLTAPHRLIEPGGYSWLRTTRFICAAALDEPMR